MREATTVPESLDTLSAALGSAESFEDFAQAAARACARAAQAEVCAIWRVYVDEGDKQRLRLAGAYGIDQRQLLAQMNYEVTPGASQYDGVDGYIASERQPVLVHSYDELLEKYKFCHKGKMDDIQW